MQTSQTFVSLYLGPRHFNNSPLQLFFFSAKKYPFHLSLTLLRLASLKPDASRNNMRSKSKLTYCIRVRKADEYSATNLNTPFFQFHKIPRFDKIFNLTKFSFWGFWSMKMCIFWFLHFWRMKISVCTNFQIRKFNFLRWKNLSLSTFWFLTIPRSENSNLNQFQALTFQFWKI